MLLNQGYLLSIPLRNILMTMIVGFRQLTRYHKNSVINFHTMLEAFYVYNYIFEKSTCRSYYLTSSSVFYACFPKLAVEF